MKLISLTQGKFTQVDDEDFEYLNQFKWCTRRTCDTFYAVRKFNGKIIFMHRIIMKTDKELITDHIDHNGLNNQKSNLRKCTHSQNQQNRKSKRSSTSKYLGVYLIKIKKNKGKTYTYWVAELTTEKKKIFSKTFKIEIEAAKAYEEAAIKHHGEFANLNFK